jgi:16S rRNA (adenine1518-N6/adenine1519-N6)-dimethyltransferase
MAQIDDLPPLSEVIRTHQLSAKKSLGQNFLLDLNLTAKIARQAGDLSGCDVLEVGPGPGGLTRGLLAEGARKVLVVEKDPRCAPILEQIAQAYPGQLDIVMGDALEVDPLTHLSAPIRVAANLPYNVGTELLVRWLTPPQWPPFWQSLTLMFQRSRRRRKCDQAWCIWKRWRSRALRRMRKCSAGLWRRPSINAAKCCARP